jgi:uncharacterized protein involved in tolerance to divalent cations
LQLTYYFTNNINNLWNNSQCNIHSPTKTKKDLFSKLSEMVKALHSYQVPEIIAMPIVKGFKPYMEWLEGSLK